MNWRSLTISTYFKIELWCNVSGITKPLNFLNLSDLPYLVVLVRYVNLNTIFFSIWLELDLTIRLFFYFLRTNLVQEHTISSGSQNGGGGGDLPPNTVVAASEGEDFDIAQIQPQGTTKRPFDIPSLADLSTTTPKPSPLLQESFSNVPNSRQGNLFANRSVISASNA